MTLGRPPATNRWAATARVTALAMLGLVSSLAGCAGGGSSGPREPAAEGSVTSQMNPGRDGFGFANFTAADTVEHFDVIDLTSMFGAGTDVCMYGNADPCAPTPEAAAFARMVNLARSSGHCEGLVVRAAELFAQRPPSPVAELANDGEVTHGVIRAFATQLFAPVRAEARGWASRPLTDLVGALGAALSGGDVRYSMGLYTQSGGHTVLPISMDRSGDVVDVGVYDPNWPGDTRTVTIDLAHDRWQFSFSSPDPGSDPSPWTGGAGDIDLVDLDTRSDGGCPFCGDGDPTTGPSGDATAALMLVRSTGSDWSLRTRGSVLTAGSSTGVVGTVRPLRAGDGVPRDYVVDVGDASDGVTVTFGSSTRVSALWPTAIIEIEVLDPASEVTVSLDADSIEVEGGVATVTVSRGHLGLAARSREMRIEHDDDHITLVDAAGGRSESVDSRRKTNSESLDDLTVDLPAALARTTDIPSVSPTSVPAPSPGSTAGSRPASPGRSPLVRVTFDLDQWARAGDDPASFGFVATDVVGGEADETQVCRSVECLSGKVVWLPRGGYDSSGYAWVLSPYAFRIDGVRGPFDIRCGRRAGWTSSSLDGGGHTASCSFDSVDADVVIALRSS